MIKEKKYYTGLDFLKVLLAVIVVIRHACQNFLEPSSIFYVTIVNILSPCAVPCFFIISGFLFFNRQANIKKQIARLLLLYISWSIIYFPFFLLNHKDSELLNVIKEFIFIGSYYHLWFLPALIVALLINYILRNKNDKILTVFFSFLFIIAVIAEPYRFLITDTIMDKFLSDYEKLFLTFRNGVFFGSIYVFIGKQISMLNRGNNSFSKRIGLFTITLLLLLIEGFCLNIIRHYSVVNILFSCLFFSPSLCFLFLHPSDKIDIKFPIRNVSTFLFCSHPLVIGSVSKCIKTIHCNSGGGSSNLSFFKHSNFLGCCCYI